LLSLLILGTGLYRLYRLYGLGLIVGVVVGVILIVFIVVLGIRRLCTHGSAPR